MDFLGGILGSIGSVLSEVGQILAYIFNLLVSVANFLWNVLQAVAQYVVDGLKAVGGFFRHLWDNFFKGIFSRLVDGVVKASRWIEDHLRPIINFLRKAQQYIDRLYKVYIQPIITMLQKVRQVLSVLRLLHIQWATKLDGILATVQHDIQQTFFTIRGVLNTTIDLLNIIADPSKLLRRPTLILSFRRSLYALIRQTTGLPPGFFIPSRSTTAPVGLGKVAHNFNPADPLQNPPPSYYLAMDAGVPSFDFLGEGETIGDGAVDDIQALDFFNISLVDDLLCTDPAACLDEANRLILKG